jgi:hypothetical protein
VKIRSRRALAALGTAALLAVPAALTTTSAAGAADGANTLTVTAGEYVYKLSGAPKPGNVEVVFDNQGVEIHMVVAMQLKSGVTAKQLEKAMMSEDEAAIDKLLSGQGFEVPAMPGLTSGGVSATTIGKLKAGHYGLVCFVPDGEGVPHIVHGMVKVFDVKGSKSTLTPPTDGVTELTVDESGFTLPANGLPKSGWVKVTNDGATARDVTLAKYEVPTMTFEQVDAEVDTFFETGKFPSGSEIVSLHGGASFVEAGGSTYFEVSLDAGRWTLVSSDNEGENEVHSDFEVS